MPSTPRATAPLNAATPPSGPVRREPSFSYLPQHSPGGAMGAAALSHTMLDSPMESFRSAEFTPGSGGVGGGGGGGGWTRSRRDSGSGRPPGPEPPRIAPNDHSAAASAATNTAYSSRVFIGLDRVLVVHFSHTERATSISAADQLLNRARVAIPAILNYLYFRAAKIAVVYLGKTRRADGVKVGVDGGDELKKKMIRFMTTEIWPPLRIDVPDDSQPAPTATNGSATGAGGGGGGGGDGSSSKRKRRQEIRVRTGDMQALIYVKRAAGDTSYVKLVLTGSDQLHFDITDSRDEKHRWEGRKLHIRMLDNLETQKAIFSYEEYERAFRDACAFCLKHGERLDGICLNQIPQAIMHSPASAAGGGAAGSGTRPSSLASSFTAPPVEPVGPPSVPKTSNLTKRSEWFGPMRTSYEFFERLDKPESATLDYKSYFSNPVSEILEKANKFMCGFLNAYGYGRLIIGVHEMPMRVVLQAKAEEAARGATASPSVLGASVESAAFGDSGNAGDSSTAGPAKLPSRAKGDDNEQIVIGVSITAEELEYVQGELAVQLQQCVPPVPPSALRIDCIPITLPPPASPTHVLILFERGHSSSWREAFHQKSNAAIRSLSRHHMSMCPIPLDERVRAHVPSDAVHVQCFAIINSTQPWAAARSPTTAAEATPLVGITVNEFSLAAAAAESDSERSAAPGAGAGSRQHQQQQQQRPQRLNADGAHLQGSSSSSSITSASATLTVSGAKAKARGGASSKVAAASDGAGDEWEDGVPARATRSASSVLGVAEWAQARTGSEHSSSSFGRPAWWVDLEAHMSTKSTRNHLIATLSAPYQLPQLYVIDVSVNCNRMDALWRVDYAKGKYFNGWPSIPVWDAMSHDVTRLGRHFDIFTTRSRSRLVPGSRCWWTDVTIVPIIMQFLFGVDVDPKNRFYCGCTSGGGGGGGVLQYRTVCGSFDEQYRTLQGADLLLVLQHWSSKGMLQLKHSHSAVRDMQDALKFSRLSMMPLLLAWTYQLFGALPSPYPLTSVPLALQPLRPAPHLVPIYYYAGANASSLMLHVALDTNDGLLKRVKLTPDGRGVAELVAVRGFGFGLIADSELSSFRRKQQEALDAEQRRTSVRNRRKSRLPATSSYGSLPVATDDPVTEAPPSICFRVLTAGDALGNVVWSLKNLLVWLQAAQHHPNIKAVGHCNRNFAFVCDLVTQVCPMHFTSSPPGTAAASAHTCGEGDVLRSPTSDSPGVARFFTPTSAVSASALFPANFDCLLHRAVCEWAQWE